MAVKVVFVGNVLAGDDGIGPMLYHNLKDCKALAGLELLELGTVGIDLISYVSGNDKLIIVDALHSTEKPGTVRLLEEDEISSDHKLVSLHDFGVEQTLQLLRVQYPDLEQVHLIGIAVSSVLPAKMGLSKELKRSFPKIQQEVIDAVLAAAKCATQSLQK